MRPLAHVQPYGPEWGMLNLQNNCNRMVCINENLPLPIQWLHRRPWQPSVQTLTVVEVRPSLGPLGQRLLVPDWRLQHEVEPLVAEHRLVYTNKRK